MRNDGVQLFARELSPECASNGVRGARCFYMGRSLGSPPMSGRLPTPVEVRRLGTQSVRIVWDDGHRSEYDNQYLRDHCPCAVCREGKPVLRLPVVGAQGAELYPAQIGVVGRYALSIQWSDGHDTGIYSYQTLRELCPCCRVAGGEGGEESTKTPAE